MAANKITTWVSKEDGTVVEGDVRFYNHTDGTYDIESTKEYAGYVLGLDKATKLYTVIYKVDDTPIMKKFKSFITIGDILVSVNDRLVIDETFEEISTILDTLMQGGFTRRLKFLNPKKCPLQLYLQRMEIDSTSHRDFFGFNCSFEYLEYERAFYASQMHLTTQRDIEWVGYLKSIGGPENLKPAGVFKPSPDLKAIVRRGIPVAYRASVWQKISLSSLHRSQFPTTYYKSLLDRAAAGELDKKVTSDIEKDLDRTFPQHHYFEPSGAGESGLRRVLQAFALHNPTVGYCQSLNFLTGMMLIFMQEEDVFWLLITVVERLLPEDYYTKNMVGTYVDQYVLAHIVKQYLPKINSAFEKHSLSLPLITVQWFMCVFVNTLRPEVALRVWDIFLNEGSKVLFRIAAALFQLNEAKLLAAKDASDLFSLLRNIGKDVIDADALISLAYKGYSPKPLLYKLAIVSPRVGGRKSPEQIFSGSTSSGETRQNRAISLSSAELVNPRLRISSANVGAVPHDLIGIGLAHMGPDKCPESPNPRTGAYSENFAYIDSVGTIGELEEYRGSLSERTSSCSSPNSKGIATRFALGNTLVSRDSGSGIGFRSPSRDRKESTEDRTSLSSLTGRPRSIRQFTPLQVSSEQLSYEAFSTQYPHKIPGVRRRPKRRKVFDFYRGDIALWRSSFRPALEEQYRVMEEARQEFRRETSVSRRYSEVSARVSEAVPAATPVTPVKSVPAKGTPDSVDDSGSGVVTDASTITVGKVVGSPGATTSPKLAPGLSSDTIGTVPADSEEEE